MLKFEKIANDLRLAIKNGNYLPGDQLPFEKDLCKKYSVSRVTIKRAVDELVMRGLVVKRRGWGTFVKNLDEMYAKELTLSMANQFSGFSETFKGRDIKTEVLKFEIVHPSEVSASKLQMSVKNFVYDITRVRILEGEPYVIEYMTMPIFLIPDISEEILKNSIYSYIEGNLKLKIQSAHRTIRAVKSSELEREHLKISDDLPILEIEQVAFLSDGRPFEYSISHHRADKTSFSAISIR